jgi:aromatic ring-opening dioxygenase catalytic subunit (LigB family)
MTSSRMPALFIGHGSPMNVLEDNVYTRAWRQLGRRCRGRKRLWWYLHTGSPGERA